MRMRAVSRSRSAWTAFRCLDGELFEPLVATTGPHSLSDLAKAIGYSQTTTWRHLEEMEAHGIVDRDPEGRADVWRLSEWCRMRMEVIRADPEMIRSGLSDPQGPGSNGAQVVSGVSGTTAVARGSAVSSSAGRTVSGMSPSLSSSDSIGQQGGEHSGNADTSASVRTEHSGNVAFTK